MRDIGCSWGPDSGAGLEQVDRDDRKKSSEQPHVWDLEKERLPQLSEGYSCFVSGESAVDNRLLWSTPILRGSARQSWVADFR
jgi:hypothetical protein